MATHLPVIGGHSQVPFSTHRSDSWWFGPVAFGLFFGSFLVYTFIVGFMGTHYYAAPYLSPVFSPVLFTDPTAAGAIPVEHAWFGAFPSWWPGFIPPSPALLILGFPGMFRLTCYYYRKAYYRAYFTSPPGCAVTPGATGSKKYEGETKLLLIHNLHRYTLYGALVFLVFLSYDAAIAFYKHGEGFGVGVGSLIVLGNPILLGCYTFGCHSYRHLVGGRLDVQSTPDGKPTLRHTIWKRVSWLNARHQNFALASMFWVGLTDVYIRLVSMGVIHDFNTWSH